MESQTRRSALPCYFVAVATVSAVLTVGLRWATQSYHRVEHAGRVLLLLAIGC